MNPGLLVRAPPRQSLIAQGSEGEDVLDGGVAIKRCDKGSNWRGGAIPDVGDEQINVSPLTAVRWQTPSRTVEMFQSTTWPDCPERISCRRGGSRTSRRRQRVRVRGGQRVAHGAETGSPTLQHTAGWPSFLVSERIARCTVTCANGSLFLLPSTIKGRS